MARARCARSTISARVARLLATPAGVSYLAPGQTVDPAGVIHLSPGQTVTPAPLMTTMMMICRFDPSTWKGGGRVGGRQERRKSARLEGLEGFGREDAHVRMGAGADAHRFIYPSNPSNPSK